MLFSDITKPTIALSSYHVCLIKGYTRFQKLDARTTPVASTTWSFTGKQGNAFILGHFMAHKASWLTIGHWLLDHVRVQHQMPSAVRGLSDHWRWNQIKFALSLGSGYRFALCSRQQRLSRSLYYTTDPVSFGAQHLRFPVESLDFGAFSV